MAVVQIGNYLVSADSETFRIFPKNKKGQTTPITRINQFLYLRCAKSGVTTVFKRYLHQKRWYWRDSRDTQPTSESAVLSEVSRMLFQGNKDKAQDLLIKVVAGAELAA